MPTSDEASVRIPVKQLHGWARGIHALTAIHGIGSGVCILWAIGTLVPSFREALAISQAQD